MKQKYSARCEPCGREVSTRAEETIGAVRIRCRKCGRICFAGSSRTEVAETVQ